MNCRNYGLLHMTQQFWI